MIQLRVTARCWNIEDNYGPFGAFFLSFFKMDQCGEESSDMVTLRKKDMLREWVCNAATEGWCADWACVAPEPKVTYVQQTSGDYDEDAVILEHKKLLAETEKQASLLSTWAAQEEDVSCEFTSMTAVLYGSAWVGISRMLTLDDVVKVRTCTRCWNDGELYGDLGDYFFMFADSETIRSK